MSMFLIYHFLLRVHLFFTYGSCNSTLRWLGRGKLGEKGVNHQFELTETFQLIANQLWRIILLLHQNLGVAFGLWWYIVCHRQYVSIVWALQIFRGRLVGTNKSQQCFADAKIIKKIKKKNQHTPAHFFDAQSTSQILLKEYSLPLAVNTYMNSCF